MAEPLRIDCGPMIGERVGFFCQQIEDTSLYLLRAVDGTVTSLGTVCDYARAQAKEAGRLRDCIVKMPKEGRDEIDPDDKLSEALNSELNGIQTLFDRLKAKRENAALAPELEKSGYRDSVVEAYDMAIACAHESFNAVSELRSVVMEHDADRSESIGTFTNVSDLMKAIRG